MSSYSITEVCIEPSAPYLLSKPKNLIVALSNGVAGALRNGYY